MKASVGQTGDPTYSDNRLLV